MVSRGEKGGPGLSRRAIVLLTVMAAISVACTGVVWAQDSGRTLKPGSASQKSAESGVIPNRYIVVLEDDGRDETAAQASADRRQAGQVASDLSEGNKVEEVTQTYGAALKGFAAEIPAGKVDDVRSDPRVSFVAGDQVVHASAQTEPTGIKRADADLDTNSVDAGNGSGAVGVDIAVLDTGIYTRHPDLTIAGGKDCSRDGKNTFSDDNGHGSHVAGTAAAEDNAGGVVGTAPGARLWSVKVLKADGFGSLSDVICGIDWVTLNADTIEVANMSLGAPAQNPSGSWYAADDGNCGRTRDLTSADAEHQAICDSVDAGVTYVAAAGNEGDDSSWYYPAAFDEVITVSALADYDGEPFGLGANTCNQDDATDDDFAFFSNYGTDVDVGAPGVCIKSTWKAVKKGKRLVPGYKTISGTSMASPHVAGAAAVYVANQNPSATPAQVRSFVVAPANTEAKGSGHFDTLGFNPEPVLQMDNY
jgi:subtilisin